MFVTSFSFVLCITALVAKGFSILLLVVRQALNAHFSVLAAAVVLSMSCLHHFRLSQAIELRPERILAERSATFVFVNPLCSAR